MKRVEARIDDYQITVFFSDDNECDELLEAQQRGSRHLVGQYSYDIHQPHTPQGQHHLVLYKRKNTVVAINRDGSGHDLRQPVKVPSKALKALRHDLPGWTLPDIVETVEFKQLPVDEQVDIILEDESWKDLLLG